MFATSVVLASVLSFSHHHLLVFTFANKAHFQAPLQDRRVVPQNLEERRLEQVGTLHVEHALALRRAHL